MILDIKDISLLVKGELVKVIFLDMSIYYFNDLLQIVLNNNVLQCFILYEGLDMEESIVLDREKDIGFVILRY